MALMLAADVMVGLVTSPDSWMCKQGTWPCRTPRSNAAGERWPRKNFVNVKSFASHSTTRPRFACAKPSVRCQRQEIESSTMSGESSYQESPHQNSLPELAACKDGLVEEEDMEVRPEAPAREVSASEILTLVLRAPLQGREPQEAPEELTQHQVPKDFVCLCCPVQLLLCLTQRALLDLNFTISCSSLSQSPSLDAQCAACPQSEVTAWMPGCCVLTR